MAFKDRGADAAESSERAERPFEPDLDNASVGMINGLMPDRALHLARFFLSQKKFTSQKGCDRHEHIT